MQYIHGCMHTSHICMYVLLKVLAAQGNKRMVDASTNTDPDLDLALLKLAQGLQLPRFTNPRQLETVGSAMEFSSGCRPM